MTNTIKNYTILNVLPNSTVHKIPTAVFIFKNSFVEFQGPTECFKIFHYPAIQLQFSLFKIILIAIVYNINISKNINSKKY